MSVHKLGAKSPPFWVVTWNNREGKILIYLQYNPIMLSLFFYSYFLTRFGGRPGISIWFWCFTSYLLYVWGIPLSYYNFFTRWFIRGRVDMLDAGFLAVILLAENSFLASVPRPFSVWVKRLHFKSLSQTL